MPPKKPWKINKDLFIYKLFYFFYFAALGAINPFLPVYFRQIGLSAFAVGLLVGTRPIIQLASAPFWTVVADKFKKRKAILIMSIMAWLIMTIALVFVEPTEEICELTGKNSSKSVFVNYTKHKTGFFKRSSGRPVTLPTRLTRQSDREIYVSRQPVDTSRTYDKNFITIQMPLLTKLDSSYNQSHDEGRSFLLNNRPNESKFLPMNNELLQKKRKTRAIEGKLVLAEQVERPEGRSTKTGNKTINLPHEVESRNISSEQSGSRNKSLEQVSSSKETMSQQSASRTAALKSVSSTGNSQTSTERSSDEQAVFDPFNMNGRSQSAARTGLARFFATTHDQTRHKSTDVHYYNMNRAEYVQHSANKTSTRNSTKAKYKHGKKKPKYSRTSKAISTRMKGHKKETVMHPAYLKDKLVNETLTLTQTNLFKSNRNEMKRLFVILLVLIVVGEFLETPSAPLSDASLLEYLGESRIHYGKQRLWGSLGHGIASFLVGMLLERSRHLTCAEEFIDYTTSFSGFTVFMLITLVISANFTFRYKDVQETENSVLSTVFTVHYISFLIAVCYMGMCQGLIHNFLMWFLEDLGGSKTLMGLAICSRNSADLIMFFIVSKLIELLGQIKIVFIALISYCTIFIAYSTMSNPWFALGVEFQGGFTFAASWTACTSYLAEAAPQESVTTMQGILQGVYWGLGLGTGSILGGHLIHTLGPHWTFRAAATGAFLIASLFALTQWRWQRENLDDSLGIYHYFSSAEPKDTEALLDKSERILSNMKTKHHRKEQQKTRREKRKKEHKKYESTKH